MIDTFKFSLNFLYLNYIYMEKTVSFRLSFVFCCLDRHAVPYSAYLPNAPHRLVFGFRSCKPRRFDKSCTLRFLDNESGSSPHNGCTEKIKT